MKRRLLIIFVLCSLLFTACNMPNPTEDKELSFRKRGIEELKTGDYETAAKAFQKALDYSNGRITDVEIDICFYKAFCLAKCGQITEAKEVYDAIINYDKDNAEAYLLRGHLYAALGDVNEAVKDYDQAIDLNNVLEYYVAAYENLNYSGYTPQAESYLLYAVDKGGKTADEKCIVGRCLLLLKRYDEAKEILSQAETEGSTEARLYMAKVLEETGDTEGALIIYENYAKAHADNVDSICQMIDILVEQGAYDSVLNYVDTALSLCSGVERQGLLKDKIIALEYTGDYEGAYEVALIYTEEFPEDQEGAKELLFLQTRVTDEEEN